MGIFFVFHTSSVSPDITEEVKNIITSHLSKVHMEYNPYREKVKRY